MTIGNFLAFIIGLFIGRVLTYLGDKTYKFLNRPKKKLENKEPLIFDGVDDFVKCAENSLKDYTVIKGDSWSAGKGHSHIIILKNKENEKKKTNKFGSMKYYSDICRCIKGMNRLIQT